MTSSLFRAVLLLLAASVALVFGSACSQQSKKVRHLAKAEEYYQAGRYNEAEIEYLNALRIEPGNIDAIARLGMIYFDQGRLGRVFPLLRRANEVQPENLEVRLKLGMVYLATGRRAEAKEAALFVLERQPQNTEAPLLLAEATGSPQEAEEVKQRLQSLAAPAATAAPSLVAQALLESRARKFKEAESLLEQARKQDPKFAAAPATLGFVLLAQNEIARAEEAFNTAASLSPPRSPRRLQRAQFYMRTGKMEEARKALEEITTATPDYLPAWLSLADIAATEKRYDDSIAHLQQILTRDPAHPEAILLIARVQLVKGDKAKAITALEHAIKLYPQAPQAHYQLGLALVSNGDIARATASLNHVLTLTPNFAPAILVLAELNIRQGNVSAAVASLKQLVQQHPEANEARMMLAHAYRVQNNLNDALAIYTKIIESSPRNPEPYFLTGLIQLQQNKRNEARRTFAQTLEVAPKYLPAFEQLVNLDLAEKQFNAARDRIQTEIAKTPAPALYILLAKVHLAQEDATGAETALLKAIELRPDASEAYLLLARIYARGNQYEKAMANLQSAATKNPRDPQPWLLMGMIQDQRKEHTAARDSYEKVLAINPRSTTALNNLAYLYSEHLGEIAKGREIAQRARDLLPGEPHAADTLGWILYKQRQFPWALSLLQESAAKLPSNAEVHFHLGMTHYMMGEEDAARLALERALQLSKDFAGATQAQQSLEVLNIDAATANPAARAALEKTLASEKDDPVALARLAAMQENEGALKQAIATYEAARAASPNNISVMVNLIRAYAADGATAKAFELAKAARKVAPESADVAHQLGRLAFETGDHPWAQSLLQEAARRQPNDAAVLYDLAWAEHAMGRLEDAEAAMRGALTANPLFNRADRARRFLEMLSWAANPAASEAKIEATVKSDPADPLAVIAQAALAENRSDAAQARELYEQALARYPEFAPAKRRLAIIYAAAGTSDPKAFDVAAKAREAFPGDAELAKAFGIIVYRQGNFTRAASLLQESAVKRATDGEVMYYLGMAQHQLKDRTASTRSLQRAIELGLKADFTAEARRVLASYN